jgi:trehalose utilization protein
MNSNINVTVWNENIHEKRNKIVAEIYPEGIHGAIASHLSKFESFNVRTATLEEPDHGLSDDVLNNTDVLIWWSHVAHKEVKDEIVNKIHNRILRGMGLLVLHSSHRSKIFVKLMGTSCSHKWREIGERQRLWVVEPGHPIAKGLGEYIDLPNVEMYGEWFDIPTPDELVFIGWFQGGEVFRSGCCFNRGRGKVFYFQPGHETYPIFHNPDIIKILKNAVIWAKPTEIASERTGFNVEPLEKINTI